MTESCRLVTTEQYKEYQLLKKKLAIALNGLYSIFDIDSDWPGDYYSRVHNVIKEIEEVK